MKSLETARESLGRLEWSELQRLMLACSEAHAAMCGVAGQDVDTHATPETMRIRIADMSKDALVAALAPFAALSAMAMGEK